MPTTAPPCSNNQICLLKPLCRDASIGFFIAGDTAQTIGRGVSYSFAATRALFYTEFLGISDPQQDTPALQPPPPPPSLPELGPASKSTGSKAMLSTKEQKRAAKSQAEELHRDPIKAVTLTSTKAVAVQKNSPASEGKFLRVPDLFQLLVNYRQVGVASEQGRGGKDADGMEVSSSQ